MFHICWVCSSMCRFHLARESLYLQPTPDPDKTFKLFSCYLMWGIKWRKEYANIAMEVERLKNFVLLLLSYK